MHQTFTHTVALFYESLAFQAQFAELYLEGI